MKIGFSDIDQIARVVGFNESSILRLRRGLGGLRVMLYSAGQRVGLFPAAFAQSLFVAYAALKLYDLPVRTWLTMRYKRSARALFFLTENHAPFSRMTKPSA